MLPGAAEWLEDFHELSTERQVSIGMASHIGPIPDSAIARREAFYPGEEEAFRTCIRAMDATYLNEVRKDPKDRHTIHKERFGPHLMKG